MKHHLIISTLKKAFPMDMWKICNKMFIISEQLAHIFTDGECITRFLFRFDDFTLNIFVVCVQKAAVVAYPLKCLEAI